MFSGCHPRLLPEFGGVFVRYTCRRLQLTPGTFTPSSTKKCNNNNNGNNRFKTDSPVVMRMCPLFDSRARRDCDSWRPAFLSLSAARARAPAATCSKGCGISRANVPPLARSRLVSLLSPPCSSTRVPELSAPVSRAMRDKRLQPERRYFIFTQSFA